MKPFAGVLAAPLVLVLLVSLLFGGAVGPDSEPRCDDGLKAGGAAQAVNGSSNVDTSMKTLMAAGLKPHQAAGVVGNWQVEATAKVDPTAVNAWGFRGIAQWDKKDRWPQLERYAAAKGLKPTSLTVQIKFALWELGLNGDWTEEKPAYVKVGAALKKASSSDEAAKVIFDRYEIALDDSLPKRQGYARALAAKYAGGGRVAVPQGPVASGPMSPRGPPSGGVPAAGRAMADQIPVGGGASVAELKARLRAAAAWARAHGWEVIEFAQEDTNHPGYHMPGSDHNTGLAFDANWPGESGNNTPGEMKHWPAFKKYLKSVGLGAIYGNEPQHLNHVHVMPAGRPNDAVKSGGKVSAQPASGDESKRDASCPEPVAAVQDPAQCADGVLSAMSLGQRAGQLLMVGLQSGSSAESLSGVVKSGKAGGVVFLGGWDGTAAVRKEATALQKQAGKTRLLLAADQEGGQVWQVREGAKVPSALVQGKASVERRKSYGASIAKLLKQAGLNLNLAPVADTVPAAIGKKNAPIGKLDRQYGSDPKKVGGAVADVIGGMHAGGVSVTVKHFPGLGRVKANTDLSADDITDSTATTKDPHLAPFKAGIEAGAEVVMVSSARYPKLDKNNQAVFSTKIINGLLRKKLGHSGLVITDDVGAAKALSGTPVAERATRFIAAGGDVVLTARRGDVAVMHQALVAKAKSDKGFKTKLTDAARRVLKTKANRGLLKCPKGTESATQSWSEFGQSSEDIACSPGTRDVGVHDGYFKGKKVRIRLCAVKGFKSSAVESGGDKYDVGGSTYGIKGAKGEVLVNSRMSSGYSGLFAAAKKAKVKLSAFSSFRSMARQRALWEERGCATKQAACLLKDGSLNTAKPGNSFHQTGLAVDFVGSEQRGTKVFKWLSKNAAAHGLGNFPKEPWHWDPSWWGNRKGGF